MRDIVLYCKSYSRDFLRLKRLLDSIEKFNKDRIPFFISTPEDQHQDLITILGNEKNYQWVSDESIIAANLNVSPGVEKQRSGGLAQQAIKSEFWRLGLSENYVCLDSDCVFIKPFSRSDFLAADGNPYTVNREGPSYFCPCPPFIWSSKVWRSLDENYLKPKNMTFWDISTESHPETLLYLEALLNYRAIPLYPIEQLFRIYYYDWHFFLLRRMGETEEKLFENYLGVIYQSNWESNLDYGAPTKSMLSRSVRALKRFFKYLASYL